MAKFTIVKEGSWDIDEVQKEKLQTLLKDFKKDRLVVKEYEADLVQILIDGGIWELGRRQLNNYREMIRDILKK